MAVKESLNAAVQRATGYRLTRETPEEREAAVDAVRRRAARRERRLTAQKKRAERRTAAAQRRVRQVERKADVAEGRALAAEETARKLRARRATSGGDVPKYFDAGMGEIIRRVRPRTMTGAPKLGALIEATRYVAIHKIPGDVVECGVWRGGSMQAVAYTLLEQGDTTRELHLFDTFEGMPPPSEHDTRTRGGESVTAEELLATSERDANVWAIAGLDDVRQGMDETGYPNDKIHYHPGLVEETTPGQAPESIAILRLDTDWYASTKHELAVLYERLSPGGVLILDDYGDWDGARKATDEWLDATGERILLAPMGSGRIAVKPS